MRHRTDPAETLAAIIDLILITLIMLCEAQLRPSPGTPATHGEEIARYFDTR